MTPRLRLGRTALALRAFDQLNGWFRECMVGASDMEVLEAFEILCRAEAEFGRIFAHETDQPSVASVVRPSRWVRMLVRKYGG